MAPLTQEDFKSLSTENRRLAQAIDHTKLTFGENEDEARAILTLCEEAKSAGFYAICVRPRHITLAKSYLEGSTVKVATVIGFPTDKVELEEELDQPTIGQFSTFHKIQETQQAVSSGADELDLVINIAQLKEDAETGSKAVQEELIAIRDVANDLPVKVIIETDLLTHQEIELATRFCAETGMAMVKTSTGMVTGGKGATAEAVNLITQTLKKSNSTTGIKASGGIKTRAQALAFLALGVNRLGTSSGLAILKGDEAADTGNY